MTTNYANDSDINLFYIRYHGNQTTHVGGWMFCYFLRIDNPFTATYLQIERESELGSLLHE